MLKLQDYLQIENPDLETCERAVKTNGYALIWMEQTEELCIEAVKQNWSVLYHVKSQTYEMCVEAMKQNCNAVRFVTPVNWTIDIMILHYLGQDGFDIKTVDQTEDRCLVAVRQNGLAIQYIKEPSKKICLEAVKRNKAAYKFINPNMLNEIATDTITDIALSMYPLRLPSYVLLEIIDLMLEQNTLTHFAKINQIIRINEIKNIKV